MISMADISPGASTIKSRRLAALFRYWRAKCDSADVVPSRTLIDPTEIPSLLPIVVLADATRPPRIRVLGTEATDLYGQEMRGYSTDDFDFGEFNPEWSTMFRNVEALMQPWGASGCYTRGELTWWIETLVMPLSTDCVKISHFFGGVEIRRQPNDDRLIDTHPANLGVHAMFNSRSAAQNDHSDLFPGRSAHHHGKIGI